MIQIENALGTVDISPEYFAALVGHAASECFGVSGLAYSTPTQGILSAITRKDTPDKGVRVRSSGNKLIIDLHIVVTYGLNISAIVKSIMHKVKYTVEDATGFEVARVNVYIDGMKPQ